jgi:4-hydroxybenzoate polyprenyltransferase
VKSQIPNPKLQITRELVGISWDWVLGFGFWDLGLGIYVRKLTTYLSFVRFSHSVFALPFALTGALLAWRDHPFSWAQVAWIIVCMVSARSAAMGFNRLADVDHDALNPRTKMRELPRGVMSRTEAIVFVVVSSVAFVYGAYRLNPICLVLSPVALAIVFWYSLAKRYTTWTQLFLGLAMAVAPVGRVYLAGVAAVAAMLVYEQSLVRADDLSQVKRAFDLNGYVGILYFLVLAWSVYAG